MTLPAGAKGAKLIKIYVAILLKYVYLIVFTDYKIFHKQ